MIEFYNANLNHYFLTISASEASGIDNGAAGPGEVELFDAGGGKVFAVFTAEFNPVPALSTGRFAKVVKGSFIMVATTEPFVLGATDPVAYTWQGEGSLVFRKGN